MIDHHGQSEVRMMGSIDAIDRVQSIFGERLPAACRICISSTHKFSGACLSEHRNQFQAITNRSSILTRIRSYILGANDNYQLPSVELIQTILSFGTITGGQWLTAAAANG